MLLLCQRLNSMLQRMMSSQMEQFKENGGFTENLTRIRLEARKEATADAPRCPRCGKPMFRRSIKRGTRQGLSFWGCSDYPRCEGTLPCSDQQTPPAK